MSVSGKKKSGGGPWLLFWLAFFIGITLLFMLNLERIKGTLSTTRVLDRLFSGNEGETDPAVELERRIQELASAAEASGQQETAGGFASQSGAASQGGTISQEGAVLQGGKPLQAAPVPLDEAAAGIANGKGQNEPKPAQDKPELKDKTVERSVYLMKVDSAGTILWTRVKRNLPASDSPLQDALEELIRGPSAAEEKQGLISLIPRNVKIQNAVVRGSTAYISLSENFLFNTYGAEGYAGQRKQIVLTATEFNNIKDVQILIDGKRVDYLGEAVWIGSPVNRNML